MSAGTFILSISGLVVFSFVIWIIALAHAATSRNFKDSNTKLMWVLIIIFTHIVGALLYLFFGRPKTESPSLIGNLLTSFRNMPLGIKILTLVFIYSISNSVLNIKSFFDPVNEFGLQINPPFSFFYILGFFIADFIILSSFFKRTRLGWNLFILTSLYQLTLLVIFKLPKAIQALFSPASEIYKIYNFNPPAEYHNAATYQVSKFAYIGLDIFMAVIMIIVLLYIYKKKAYFIR